MNENKRLLKNTALLSLGALTPRLIGIITLPIVTSNLTTSEYGTYDLILSVAAFLIPLLTLQIQQGTFRYLLLSRNDEMRKAYISSTVLYLLVTLTIASLLGLIGMYLFKVPVFLALCICLMIIFESIYIVFGQVLRGMEQNIKYTFSIIIYSISYFFWMLIFVLWLKMSLLGVLLSVTLGYLMATFYMIIQREIKHYISLVSCSKIQLKEMLTFSAPIVPSAISLWIVNMSDRIVITSFLGVGMNGIYSAANKIPTLYSTAYNIFNMAWTESAVRTYETNNKDKNVSKYYEQMFRNMYNFLIGFMLVLIATTPIMFMLLLPDTKYDMAYYQIPILYFGVFFSSLVAFYGSIYIALKQTKHVAVSSTVGALLNLIINLLLVKSMGLSAASLSTVISYLVICIYRWFDIQKMVMLKYNYTEIIIGIFVFIFSAISCYCRCTIGYIVCAVVAVIYNVIFNSQLMIRLLKAIIQKVKRGLKYD